jgi:hypothetical protein
MSIEFNLPLAREFALFALLSLATAQGAKAAEPPAGTPGSTKESAIEVCKPAGEREYLARLSCANGEAPTYERIGSLGARIERQARDGESEQTFEERLNSAPLKAGQIDRHIVDGYALQCGTTKHLLHFDMYHCNQAQSGEAPAGFTLRRE